MAKKPTPVVELRDSVDKINDRLDELNNKFLLLQEKVEANREAVGGSAGESGAEGFSTAPPKGLKVVKLTEKKPAAEEREVTGGGKGPSPEQLYSRGQDLFIAGKYERARKVFSRLVEEFPIHNLADNALYWSGEAYYSEGDYEKALAKFNEVAERYPGENKAPDALLKVAFSHIELHEAGKASSVLKRIIKLYPESGAADKAGEKLEEISPLN
ncbi:MAG: tol-pal system protein YbgF [Thermodesulfobacteriota bacterium]